MTNQTEKQIENAILEYLSFRTDCYAWKNNTTGIFDKERGCFRKPKGKYLINGVSDILGVFRGRFLAIEVKTPKNKKRPEHQVAFLQSVNEMGGIGFFATSVKEVEEKLKS